MTAALLLVANTLFLGLRHGLDLDHLAAISDIVGASTQTENQKRHSFTLCSCYVVGHAVVVTLLGSFVIFLGDHFPPWIERISERAVAITLIALGIWLTYAAFRRTTKVHPVSRNYGPLATVGIGMIHGIGAETGTQMLMLAAVGGTTNSALAFALLLAFVAGILISNTGIAVASVAGFTLSRRLKTLSLGVSMLTALFSIWLGISMLL